MAKSNEVCQNPNMEERQLMVIDTDCGVDDARAIVMALQLQRSKKSKYDVIAISTVAGNTGIGNVNSNVFRVLQLCSRTDIPVYQGSACGLTNRMILASEFHGKDGLGDVAHEFPTGDLKLQKEVAAVKIAELADKYKGRITMVTLAPLTNLALAHRIDPQFTKNLKEIFIMGGNSHGVGNTTAVSEFNFICDPEAADIILSEAQCAVTIIPWETCSNPQQGWSWTWYDDWLAMKQTKISHFLQRIGAQISELTKSKNMDWYHCCDSWAMAVALDPRCIAETEHRYVRVETAGVYSRGLMVIDRNDWTEVPAEKFNAHIVTKLDRNKVQELSIAML